MESDRLAGQGDRRRHPGGARPLRRAAGPVHLRRPGPDRDAARRPAPRQLPHHPRRRRVARAGWACSTSAPWPGCPAARFPPAMGRLIRIADARRQRRAAGRAARARASSRTRSGSTQQVLLDYLAPVRRADGQETRSASPGRGCAGSSSGSTTRSTRATPCRQAQPAAVVPPHPPHLARRHRAAQPARGRGTVPVDPRGDACPASPRAEPRRRGVSRPRSRGRQSPPKWPRYDAPGVREPR